MRSDVEDSCQSPNEVASLIDDAGLTYEANGSAQVMWRNGRIPAIMSGSVEVCFQLDSHLNLKDFPEESAESHGNRRGPRHQHTKVTQRELVLKP